MKRFFDSDTERRGARARLRDLIRQHSLRFGQFRLASGGMSHFYLDLRRTTTHPEGAYLTAYLILDRLGKDWPDAIGGPTLGADPIVGALAALSHLHGAPLPAFIVRSTAKSHGTRQDIEGHLPEGGRVLLVDDVMTQGGSLVRAAEAVRARGCEVARAIVILDRGAGGRSRLEEMGITCESIFALEDVLKPEEMVPPGAAEKTPTPAQE